MSEVVYNVLNFERPISEKTLQDVVKDFDAKGLDKSKAQLSEEQLGILISVLFTYGLHYDEIDHNKRPRFLSTIIENKLPLYRISQIFSLHLLNNLDSSAKAVVHELLKKEHDLNDILSNEELLDFVEMELLDPVRLHYRKWEYGRFSLAYLATFLIRDRRWKKVAENNKGKTNVDEDYLSALDKHWENKVEKLRPKDKHWSYEALIKGKLWPKSTSTWPIIKSLVRLYNKI